MRRLALLVILAACGSNSSSSDTPDAGGGGTSDAPPAMCKPKVAIVGSGHHNPGLDCMGPCHNHGFTAAGTVYATGTTPVSGATVTITDAQGHVVEAISQANGNFYTSLPLAFPVSVYVSSCPSVATMTDHIMTSSGCNAAGACHGGTEGRIHLP